MADIVTGTITGQLDTSSLVQDHSDIRAEGFQQSADIRRDVMGMGADGRFASAGQSADIRRENAIAEGAVIDAVKTAGWHNSDRTGTEADRIVQQETAYFIAAQNQNFANSTAIAALKATTDASTAATLAAIQLTAQQATAATALEGAKNAAASALGQAMIGQAIAADGNQTRALINDLKYNDLNRALIERNTELTEAKFDSRHWRDRAEMGQYASLTSQLQAFGSQLQEVRQGTVNFGTMSGNAGRNTSTNNVV